MKLFKNLPASKSKSQRTKKEILHSTTLPAKQLADRIRSFLKFPKTFNIKFNHKLIFSLAWPYIALIIAHTIWGANFIAAKLTLQEIPPMSLAFLRFSMALLLITPFLLVEKDRKKIRIKELPRFFMAGVMMITIHIAFFFLGLAWTSASEASILSMIVPILSIFFAWIWLKEKIYTKNLAGIILGLIGAILVIGAPLITSNIEPQRLVGNLFIILSAICWVIGAIISKPLLKNHSTLTLTAMIFLVGVLTFALPAVQEYLKNPAWPSQVTYLGVLGLIYITFLSSVTAYFLFEWGLGKLGVVKADLFQYIQPVIAVGLGILLLGETGHPVFFIGAILILIGVYWGTLNKDEHKHHKAHRV